MCFLQETQRLMAEPVPGIQAVPDETNARYFKVVVAGPKDVSFWSFSFWVWMNLMMHRQYHLVWFYGWVLWHLFFCWIVRKAQLTFGVWSKLRLSRYMIWFGIMAESVKLCFVFGLCSVNSGNMWPFFCVTIVHISKSMLPSCGFSQANILSVVTIWRRHIQFRTISSWRLSNGSS